MSKKIPLGRQGRQEAGDGLLERVLGVKILEEFKLQIEESWDRGNLKGRFYHEGLLKNCFKPQDFESKGKELELNL